MGKQTMGTPLHALASRADNKLYKLQTPQSPLVRPHAHDHYKVDEYPLGTNAVVAVISYTVSGNPCVARPTYTTYKANKMLTLRALSYSI